MTVDGLLYACLNNQIPVTALRMGRNGMWFVNGLELEKFLSSKPAAPATN